MKLADIFNKALAPFMGKQDSAKAFSNLEQGKKIDTAMRSDRYTYNSGADVNYDKKWTPSTPTEKKTLSPEGYYRQGDRKAERQERMKGIYDSAMKRAAAINEDQEKAREEAEDQFNDQYREKQISIPSTALSSIKYDPDTEGLEVTFTSSGKKYFYPGVPVEKVQALMKAPSKGEYFMSQIHDQYSMNKSHRPVGQSPTYGKQSKAQVDRFYRKYVRSYKKNNKGKWKA